MNLQKSQNAKIRRELRNNLIQYLCLLHDKENESCLKVIKLELESGFDSNPAILPSQCYLLILISDI